MQVYRSIRDQEVSTALTVSACVPAHDLALALLLIGTLEGAQT